MSMVETARKYLGVQGQSPVHKELVDYYNTYCYPYVDNNRKYKMTYYDDWCAMFCSVMAHMNNIQGFPYEVSVYYMWKKAEKLGTATRTPRVNDLIIFDWGANGTLDHVGIVSNVSGDIITTIEGNAGNQVTQRTINRYNPEIRGFIRVNSPSQNTSKPQPTQTNKQLQRLIVETMGGKYGNGEVRRRKLGKNYNAVQNAINRMSPTDFMAYDVINGKYGTGDKRKKLLGKNYNVVQSKVNNIMKNL